MDRVFAYGSLTAAGGEPARLAGFRRVWGVAMDNAVDLPAYKHYVDPDTGERPAVCVAFLDLVEDPDAAVDGVLLGAPDLEALDRRERNYERRDVSDRFGSGRVWTYTGRPESRARLRHALAAGTLVVQRAYLELVAVPEPPPCPVRDLLRVESAN